MPALPLEDDIPFKVKYTVVRPPKPKQPRASRKRKSIHRRSRTLSVSGNGAISLSPSTGTGTPTTPTTPSTSTPSRDFGMNTEEYGNGNGYHNVVSADHYMIEKEQQQEQVVGRPVVRPNNQWMSLRRFRNFARKDETFSINDYVFVENPNAENPHHLSSDTSDNESSSDEQSHTASTPRRRSVQFPPTPTHKRSKSESNNGTPKPRRWIARVDEICASSRPPERVFLRVSWLYRPEDLPAGRQPYHGKRELVMSNHVDVVDALSVSGRAEVVRWEELDEEDEGLEMYWRQEVDVIGGGLSEIRTHCSCRSAYNPDSLMLWCDHCRMWLHSECVVDDVLRRYSATSKAARRASGRSRNHSISTALALTNLSDVIPVVSVATNNKRKSISIDTSVGNPWDAPEDDLLEGLRRELRPRLVLGDREREGKTMGVKHTAAGRKRNGIIKREHEDDSGGGCGAGRPRVQMRRKVWGAGSEGGQVFWEDVECLVCRRRVE